ncbi:tetratricopeptide repeat protein [Tenacibaculum aquimarinum]|uniref:tetratricopeptide repeat protein n=1 Tax=Tenacibaculum aquimarinum TaxID=2910675 RepID=UPI001F0B5FA3|nr:tetratricopeptide repeat protein [Tenacibaculum aquimarinum]MCH3883611.1 tetratricopeptide repeat protein [Tenacibaculum aquimarinum]
MAQSDYPLAENYYRNNEYEKALQIFQKLADKSPYNTTYIQRLVDCYQELNRFSSVDSLLTLKQKKNKRLTFYNVLLGYNYERQQQPEKAIKLYKKAIKSIDKNANYGTTIAGLLKNYNQLDLAIEAYNATAKKRPKSSYGFQIAQVYGEKGDFPKMFESYIDLVDKIPSRLKTVKRYTAKYITDDSESEINIAFKKALLRKSTSNPKAIWNSLLSWLFVQQKEYNKALIQEKALFARNADELANVVNLGEIAFFNNDFETAQKCFNFILEKTNYPDEKVNAHLYLLKIAIKQEQPKIEDEFQAVFSEFGKNENTLPIQVEYANYVTFVKNEPAKSQEILEEAMNYAKSKFQQARIKLKLADVLVFTGKFNKALIYYTQIQSKLKSHPLAQQARFKVAQTSYFKGDFAWAKAQLKVLKGSATQLIANDAVALFLTISDNEPKDSIPSGLKQIAQSDLFSFQNKNAEALAVLEEVFVDFGGQPIEYEAFFKKGKLLVKLKKYDEAILTFAEVVANDAEGIYNDDVYYEVAELFNKLNKPEKAQEYYQKIIFEHPSSIYLVDARKKFRKLRGDDI